MEHQSVSTYTMKVVEPFVADAFYLLTQRYTCQEVWNGPKFKEFGSRKIVAQPILPSLTSRSVISPRAMLDVALAEYTCKIEGGATHPYFAVQPGEKYGEVRLRAGVDVEFKVYEGRSHSIKLANGVVSGIVCPAQEYRLSDDTVCVKLDTRAGNVWLRTKPKKWGMFERRIFPDNQAPTGMGFETVVELAEWHYAQDAKEPWAMDSSPWMDLKTRDTSGRLWIVTKSRVAFSAGMRGLGLDDVEVQNFRGQPRLKLEPPYEVVWQPTFDTYVPLSDY